ncbi:bifunctional serine/threonine-protein kinase/ABC transporter substrate-binding protein [Leptolyngbya sp. GGD]|nr:bifunctional serine/threonine-protein kinase/ABC transporter substrate-binding protein [Leptolyngbya sp. GGD]MCY6491722.1 bifunctional serine/threonine-protein kinase/ABC transporter substrate-binding protein [Leptolyngbya sp. GGD]
MPLSLFRAAMLGRILDARYKILQPLGSGGFGQTYIAEDTKRPGNPRCVLKHLSFSSQDEAILRQVRRMFFAEAETLERLGRHDQIPRLLAYFEEDQEFYLVQEFIQGHPLSEEIGGDRRLAEAQVVDLVEDVTQVLGYVHEQGVIHRDLKPENLIRRDRDQKLVLIDFGAVKTILESSIATEPVDLSVPIYTSGYAASEQCLGQPRYNSDFYSLGMIAIQALTGVRPSQLAYDPNTHNLLWRDRVTVSHDFAAVLEKMTQFHFNDRYQTAAEILEALNQVKSSIFTQMPISEAKNRLRSPKPVLNKPLKMSAIAAGLTAIIGASAWTLTRNTPTPTDPPGQRGQFLSVGQTLLSPNTPPQPLKQAAIDKMKSGEFAEAVSLFEQAHKIDQSDPETLIYLNNARIGSEQANTIAVVLPIRTNPTASAEVLRGIAQAQDRINQTKAMKLKIAIASDDANPDLARQIATQLVRDPTVLGVIGHGTSDTTLAAGKIYQEGELVAISPVSSAKNLSGFSRYVFRTMPSDELPAKRLVSYMTKQLKKRKAAVFFNSKNLYSKSLTEAFKDALYYADKGKVVHEVDLSNPAIEVAENVAQAMKKGAEVIFLAPNAELLDRTLLIINANQKRLPILAGDALYNSRILTELGSAASGMVVAIPSAQTQLQNSPFEQQAKSVWGRAPGWRSALGYDATQAMIAALQKAPTRNGIRATLSTPSFTTIGAVQSVSFTPEGDRETEITLVRVTGAKSGKFIFQPIPK